MSTENGFDRDIKRALKSQFAPTLSPGFYHATLERAGEAPGSAYFATARRGDLTLMNTFFAIILVGTGIGMGMALPLQNNASQAQPLSSYLNVIKGELL